MWNRIIGYNHSKVSILLENALNGPDSKVRPEWMDVITRAARMKKKVLGYVRTGYLGLAPAESAGPFEPFVTRLGSGDIADWVAQIQSDVDAWYR